MLDDLNELKTLQAVVLHRSLTVAARQLGVSLAVVSKRLTTLEKRAGVRLLNRTTRNLVPTEEGERLLVEIDRALDAIRQGEEGLASSRDEPVGTLRVSAPVSFGRRHVAPVLSRLCQEHRRLSASLSLDDRLVDVAGGMVDVAIRIGGCGDSGAVARKLAANRRILVAAPAYLDDRGRPEVIDDIVGHDLLRYGDITGPWRMVGPGGEERLVPVTARLRVNSGDVIHDWSLAGLGIMLKSEVDVLRDLQAGALERVLPDWDGGESPIIALFSARSAMPRKTRMFIDATSTAMS